MTVVSTKEFNTHQKKYFDLAANEQVFIKRGKNRYRLELEMQYPEQPISEPDDAFRSAITMDQLQDKLHRRIHELFTEQ